MMKKIIAVVLSVLLLCLSLAVLSSCSDKEDENTFTWLIENSEDTTYYSDYNQNPVAIFAQHNQQYAGVDVTIDYKQLVKGSEKDQYTTMVSTGEYYDVMGTSFAPYSPLAMYDMGIVMDITEYVENYMPNYMKLIEENDALHQVAYCKDADGNKIILQLYGVSDIPGYNFCGYCYRRDWLVKYGVNPSTGEAFTGGYTAERDAEGNNDPSSWTDNVMFPSWYSDSKYVTEYKANHPEWDGSEPIFISDWEWMFEIFDKAREALGVFDQGYDISISYTGYMFMGNLYSSFGGGAPTWSYNKENGEVEFNATSDSMKAYLECLNTWYEKGWLDNAFAEHASDMFYKIDTTKVYGGYVGMWLGNRSTLAHQLEEKDIYPATEDIFVAGAPYPINDIYGNEDCKGSEPDAMYQFECTVTSIVVTESAKDKNLEALFTYLDTFYDPDHPNYIAKNYGLTKEQYEFIEEYQEKIDGQTFQERFGINEDSYTITEKDGHRYFVFSETLFNDPNLRNAAIGNRLNSYSIASENTNMSDWEYHSVAEMWDKYINTAYIQDSFTDLLSTEKSAAYSKISTKVNEKMSVELPKFINGTYDVNSADWDTYVKTINKMGHEKITGYLQEVYDSLN